MSWLRRKLPANIWKWRWVPTAYGFARMAWDFIAWMGWTNLLGPAMAVVLSWLLSLATPLGLFVILAVGLGGWFLVTMIQFMRWRKSLSDPVVASLVERRMSFVEFAKHAVPALINDGEEPPFLLWDLCLAVRQEAADGKLVLDGKRSIEIEPGPWLHTQLLTEIPRPDWAVMQISCLPSSVLETRNEEVTASSYELRHKFFDLHLRNAGATMIWLKSVWPSKQGVSYGKYKESERRRAERNTKES